MVTFLDELQATNWERYASVTGRFLPFLVFGTAVLGFILHTAIGIQVYTFFVSLFVALLETPFVYACFPPLLRVKDRLIDDFGFKKGWMKGLLYIVFSIMCYIKPSISILAGILLAINGLFYLFSSIFAEGGVGEVRTFQDKEAGGGAAYVPPPTTPGGGGGAAPGGGAGGSFGTF